MTGGDTMQDSTSGGVTTLDWNITSLAVGVDAILTYQVSVLAP